MAKDPDFSYLNANGRRVAGTASVLHHIYSDEGGLLNHDKNVALEFFKNFISNASDEVQRAIVKEAKKSHFRKAV